MLTISIPGEMRGQGRPRFARIGKGVRAYADSKTTSAAEWVRHCAVTQVGQPCLEGPLTLSMVVTVQVPASWSKRKQANAIAGLIRPTSKPDASNMLKLVEDALNKIIWKDDSQLVGVRISKQYGTTPGALLEVGTA